MPRLPLARAGRASSRIDVVEVADSGRWRWVTGAGDGRTGHGGDGLEVEVERREEEARALTRLGRRITVAADQEPLPIETRMERPSTSVTPPPSLVICHGKGNRP